MVKERITFSTRRFLVGKAGPFPRLVFREEVMLALDQFSHRHTTGEQGGFLIGRKKDLKTAEQYEIIVERFVPIPQKGDASRLVINQDHYNSVKRALGAGGQGEEIVGWAHTHPGFGVFLSPFDKEQHERFFPEPWQVAYIMDNQGHERAVYHLVGDEWNTIDGYYVLRDMAENEVGIVSADRSTPWLKVVLAVLVIFVLIAGGTFGYSIVRQMFLEPTAVEEVVTEPEESSVAEPEHVSQPMVVIQRVETQQPEPAVPAQTTIAPPPTVPRYLDYTVKKGDTLWSIAQDLWGDPSLFRIIVEENNIKNPSNIAVGTVLRVPADPKR
ncbi:MAG: LysM peptidoglycan-binding domain-containing protein [Firmicutes bacterium]|nr:LysM peptidoglycan-binding domain-containing protein [Bacillota bacterium]